MRKQPFISVIASAGLIAITTAAQAVSFKADDQYTAVFNGNVLSATGSKTYGRGVLKADEVKACVALANQVNELNRDVQSQKATIHGSAVSQNEENAALKKMNADLATQKASISKRTKALAAEKSTLDMDKKDAVDAFNARSSELEKDKEKLSADIKEFNARAEKWNAAHGDSGKSDVSTFNDKVTRLDKLLDQFDDMCGSKDYYADDYAAAKAALKQ